MRPNDPSAKVSWTTPVTKMVGGVFTADPPVTVMVTVTSGPYDGASWTGSLADAPVSILIPEGIISDRTTREADDLRRSIGRTFASAKLEGGRYVCVHVTCLKWTISVTDTSPEAYGKAES